jgi:uncharacterized protein
MNNPLRAFALAFASAVAATAWASPSGEAVRLETATGTVHGTLLLPADRDRAPVALLIAGSGPTDRDGNTVGLPGPNNSLKLLAEGLAMRGVASLRYDKRGIGESRAAGPSEAELRFDMYVDDAAGWIRRLQADSRFVGTTVIGHSEGSLIGMMAAAEAEADAFVSVAGISRQAGAVLRDQLRPQLPPSLWAESERILEALEAGEQAGAVPAELQVLYRPSVQPYMISWLRHAPVDAIAQFQGPVLILQGTTDIQVAVEEAHALAAAHPGARLHVIEGMNHVLKQVPADIALQHASYSDPSLPVSPELLDLISAYLLAL